MNKLKLFNLAPISDHHEWDICSTGTVENMVDIIYQFNGGFVSEENGRKKLYKTKKAEELDILDIVKMYEYQGIDYWRDWGTIGVYDINVCQKAEFVCFVDNLNLDYLYKCIENSNLNTYEISVLIPVLGYRTETYQIKAKSLNGAEEVAENIALQSYNNDFDDTEFNFFVDSETEIYNIDKLSKYKVLSINQI